MNASQTADFFPLSLSGVGAGSSALLALTLAVAVVTVVAPGNLVRMQYEAYAKDPSPGNVVRQVLAAIPRVPKGMIHLLLWQDNTVKLLLPILLWLPAVLYWQRRGWLGSSIRLPWY